MFFSVLIQRVILPGVVNQQSAPTCRVSVSPRPGVCPRDGGEGGHGPPARPAGGLPGGPANHRPALHPIHGVRLGQSPLPR